MRSAGSVEGRVYRLYFEGVDIGGVFMACNTETALSKAEYSCLFPYQHLLVAELNDENRYDKHHVVFAKDDVISALADQ